MLSEYVRVGCSVRGRKVHAFKEYITAHDKTHVGQHPIFTFFSFLFPGTNKSNSSVLLPGFRFYLCSDSSSGLNS